MRHSIWIAFTLFAMHNSLAAEPKIKVSKGANQENSYTYYNWKPQKPRSSSSQTAETAIPSYQPVRPSPQILNPAAAPQYLPGQIPPSLEPVPIQPNYTPYADRYVSPPMYLDPYASPVMYNQGVLPYAPAMPYNNCAPNFSLTGIYHNRNLTIQASMPGPYWTGSGLYRSNPGFSHSPHCGWSRR